MAKDQASRPAMANHRQPVDARSIKVAVLAKDSQLIVAPRVKIPMPKAPASAQGSKAPTTTASGSLPASKEI